MSLFMRHMREIAPEHIHEFFIDYESLKRTIARVASAPQLESSMIQPRSSHVLSRGSDFQSELERELEKVNLYAEVKYEDLLYSLNEVCESCMLCDDDLSLLSAEKQLYEFGKEIFDLDFFTRHNYSGFVRLAEKFDKCTKVGGSVWFVSRLSNESFATIQIDRLVLLLSVGWSRYRGKKEEISSKKKQSTETTWVPPSAFVRSTEKYWVKQEKIIFLKTLILPHVPLLFFGFSLKDQEELLSAGKVFERPSFPGELSPQLISSVYFDSADGKIYTSRLLREEGAKLLRLRWYGSNDGRGDKEIFVERKIHHESWSKKKSVKERFSIPQTLVPGFLTKGRGSSDPLAKEVYEMIRKNSMRPTLRTCYYRTAFQEGSSNAVRISLDSHLTFINELKNSVCNDWCRAGTEILSSNDVTKFPFCILEVKLQQQPPAWLEEALRKVGAIKVHKFSKFIHGTASLHPVSVLPHWFPQFMGERGVGGVREDCAALVSKTQSGETNENRIDKILRQVTQETIYGGHNEEETETAPVSRKSTEPITGTMRLVEPKSLFANERTFLHYVLKSLYLLSFGSYLLRSPKNHSNRHKRFLGAFISVGMIMYVLWCYFAFRNRQATILQRKANDVVRLDFPQGPYVLAALVVGSFLGLIAGSIFGLIS